MRQSNMQTYRKEAKAAHKYKVVDADGKPSVAGKRFHFIGAGGSKSRAGKATPSQRTPAASGRAKQNARNKLRG